MSGISIKLGLFAVLSTVLLLTQAGCGGGKKAVEGRPKVVPVSGVVMLQGQPLAGATVLFHSETEEVTATGLSDDQGRFTLRTYAAADGAVPGTHKVTVKKTELKVVPNPDDPNLGPISSEEIWITPKNYGSRETTPLQLTVGEKGEKDLSVLVEAS